jgi:uncharacterized protein (DUF58 family)
MIATLRRRLHERFAAWALRINPPEAVPILLTQRRIYVLPTRAGLMYALALAVMLIGAINYNLGLGHALVFLLAGLGFVAILHTFRNLVGLRLTVGVPTPVFAGDTARFPLRLHNAEARPRRRLRMTLPDRAAETIDVPPRDVARVLLSLPATRRGWLALPRVTLDTVWPLGLIRAWSYAAPELLCLVYPRPATAGPPIQDLDGVQDGRPPSDSGDADFAGLRRHQPSDPPHHVAWKSAARLGPDAALQTKQFAGTTARALWLDWEALPPGIDLETRLSVLTRWTLDAEKAGLSWGLRLPGRTLPQARGQAHLHACLKALALHGQER